MKNRYKALIIAICFLVLLILIAFLLGFSFHFVNINQYGYARNRVFGTISNQTVFSPGNYFIGIDHDMILFPAGLIKYEFNISCNTIDKSFLTVEALFIGQFLPSQLSIFNQQYGDNYDQMLKLSIQQAIRQTLEQFTLVQIVSERRQIQGQVFAAVKQNIESSFNFIYCRLLSLGGVGVDLPNTSVMIQNPSIYQLRTKALNESNQLQKQINFLSVGGKLLRQYQKFHSQLFKTVGDTLNTSPNNSYLAFLAMSEPITKGLNLDKIYIKL